MDEEKLRIHKLEQEMNKLSKRNQNLKAQQIELRQAEEYKSKDLELTRRNSIQMLQKVEGNHAEKEGEIKYLKA